MATFIPIGIGTARHLRGGEPLKNLSVIRRTASARADRPVSDLLEMGRVLNGRYVVEHRLGRSSDSTVLQVWDRFRRNPADQHIALKILESGSDPQSLADFHAEFHGTRALCHRNILKVHELGQIDGAAFYSMEFVDGRPLSSSISRWKPLHIPRPEAWNIIAQLSAALTHAHSQNIVHGNLRPQNIMISRTGEVRILAFGAAHDADPRDDIFDLACIAYELLSGSRPFQHRRPQSVRERRVKPGRFPGLSRRQWQTLASGFAAEPDKRPASAAGWFAGLDPAGAHTAVPLPQRRREFGAAHVRRLLPRSIAYPVVGSLAVFSILLSFRGPSPADSAGETARSTMGSSVSAIPAVNESAVSFTASAGGAAPAAAEPTRRDAVSATKRVGRIAFTDRTYVGRREHFAEIRVRGASSSEHGVQFNWWTEGASAKSGTDFVAQGPVTQALSEGRHSASLFVKLLPNDARKQLQTFYVAVADAGSGGSTPSVGRIAVVLRP